MYISQKPGIDRNYCLIVFIVYVYNKYNQTVVSIHTGFLTYVYKSETRYG